MYCTPSTSELRWCGDGRHVDEIVDDDGGARLDSHAVVAERAEEHDKHDERGRGDLGNVLVWGSGRVERVERADLSVSLADVSAAASWQKMRLVAAGGRSVLAADGA
jgi:hypothetical protein